MFKISVLIPAYNSENTILKALNSIPIRNDLEIVVANDCSTDNTLDSIFKYRGNILKILNFKINHGVGYMRNQLIKNSTGEWICWLDSDDYFYTEELNNFLNNLDSYNSYNKVNYYMRLNNGTERKGGCESALSIFKRDIYKLLLYPEIRSAEDWYFKKKLYNWYGDSIKETTYKKVIYHYNSPRPGSLYDTKKKLMKNTESKEFKYIEDPNIIKLYNTPIDIVVTYVDSSLPHWQGEYNRWRRNDLSTGVQNESNIQAFGPERFRNWGDIFKYWFRGVENNLPWIRYVHFVCMDETHIPDWVNKNNPKLKIDYHKDFIPSEYLPTFSGLTIETFLGRIKNLSDYYISSNDDIYFVTPSPKTLYTNGTEFYAGDEKEKYEVFSKSWGTWGQILNNSLKYLSDKKYTKRYALPHLHRLVCKKSDLELVNDINIVKKNTISRFRHSNNVVTSYISYNISLNTGRLKPSHKVYENSKFTSMTTNTNFNEYKNYQAVCLNDSERIKNNKEVEIILNRLILFFEEIFPSKSSFEK